MLEGIRSWVKDLLQKKSRDPSEPHITSEPRPTSILRINSNSNAVTASPAPPVPIPRTPQISFATPASNSLPLRHSPGTRSLLPQYGPDTSRSVGPLPLTPTQPTSSHLSQTVLLGSAPRQRAATGPKSPRRITSTGPPSWMPSGTISMISRTTHQTYSTDPSPLFTGALQNINLSPPTTAVVTPSPVPKTGQVFGSDTKVVENPVTTVIVPSLQEQASPPVEKETTVMKTNANSVARVADEYLWIKMKPSGHPLQPLASSAAARALVVPSISIRPPTPANSQTIDEIRTKSPVILGAAIVDSPEGSVASSDEFSHSSDSRKAAAASDSGQSRESEYMDAVSRQISDRTVTPGRPIGDVQQNSSSAGTVKLVPHMQGRSASADVRQAAEASVANVQNMPEQLFADASETLTHVQYRLRPVSPLLASSPATPMSGHQPRTVERQGVQMVAHVGPVPVSTQDADNDCHAEIVSHIQKPSTQSVSSAPLQEYDPSLKRRLENISYGQSPPISRLPLLRRPGDNVLPVLSPNTSDPVNHILNPSVDQGPYSVLGPNALPFAADHPPPTESVPDFPGCPRYPALSLVEFLPFRRPDLLIPPHKYLNDDQTTWLTSAFVDIQTNVLPQSPKWTSSWFGRYLGIPNDRPRRYTTLGVVSESAGKLKYLVYNKKSCRDPHTLTLFSPMGMDPVGYQRHSNHLMVLRYLTQQEPHDKLAVYYDDAPTIWYCPDEYIWYLGPGECGTLDLWNGAVEESQMPLIIRDLVSGLKFLHMLGIIHCDLRAHNIILDYSGYCRIGNFERAEIDKPCDPQNDRTWESWGMLDNISPHTAPELLRRGFTYHCNHAVDMWALGIIVCELQMGTLNIEPDKYTTSDLANDMILYNTSPELFRLTFQDLLVEDFRHRAVAENVINCQYLAEARRSRAPPFRRPDIPPLWPQRTLPILNLDQHHNYMKRRQARQAFENFTGCKLDLDHSFLVGRDC